MTAVGLLATIALACGAQRGGPVGTSTGAPASSPRPQDAGTIAADAGIPGDFETAFARMTIGKITSVGHTSGRWDAEIFANDLAKGAFTSDAGDVPVGGMLVMIHTEHAGGQRGPTMMMEKRAPGYDAAHGDWRYVVVTASGQVVQDGPAEGCSGCHDDAPHDRMFRAAQP